MLPLKIYIYFLFILLFYKSNISAGHQSIAGLAKRQTNLSHSNSHQSKLITDFGLWVETRTPGENPCGHACTERPQSASKFNPRTFWVSGKSPSNNNCVQL